VRVYLHCPWCGERLGPPEGNCQVCAACGEPTWQNAKPCGCAILVRDDGRVLLTRRGIEPFFGMWDVPGGFLEPDETPEQGVARELLEETGLEVEVGRYVTAVVDTYGQGGDHTLNLFYECRILRGEAQPADDVSELGWFVPEELPLQEIAFQNGAAGLRVWLAKR
jgi:ADP-ribose pyrophosphatase YjhB (NUDIX family)